MNYTRTYNTHISGSVSGSVSYPKSDSGGSTTVTMNWTEPVSIDITVDTTPFDHSVDKCKGHVDLLSGAIVAAQGVTVFAKTEASSKIGTVILNGFFRQIRSEISQQMTSVGSRLVPMMQKLSAQSARCLALREQMQGDFARISERYTKLFGGLDEELRRRIHMLDQRAFTLQESASDRLQQSFSGKQASVASVSNGEQMNANTVLLLSSIKKHAHGMIQSGKMRIVTDHELSRDLSDIVGFESGSVEDAANFSVPVVFVETEDPDTGARKTECHGPSYLKNPRTARIVSEVQAQIVAWEAVESENWSRIETYWNDRLRKWLSSHNDEASLRTATMINNLWEGRSGA